jgi:hypothetical protein
MRAVKGSNYIAISGPGHHHHGHHGGGGRGGFMPYPFPVQYAPSELVYVDRPAAKPSQICNPTPPIKPVPGLYKDAKGQYCWPTPALSGPYESDLGCACAPASSAMGLFPPEGITDWLGIGLIAYLGYKFFWDPHAGESRRAKAHHYGRRVAHHARRRR